MILLYDYWTGSVNNVFSSLDRSIIQYTTQNRWVKIGVTNNPERRMLEHKRSGIKWDCMIVKYETSSIYFVSKLEALLVNKHWDYVVNEIGGGGGGIGLGKQYLYVLTKK